MQTSLWSTQALLGRLAGQAASQPQPLQQPRMEMLLRTMSLHLLNLSVSFSIPLQMNADTHGRGVSVLIVQCIKRIRSPLVISSVGTGTQQAGTAIYLSMSDLAYQEHAERFWGIIRLSTPCNKEQEEKSGGW